MEAWWQGLTERFSDRTLFAFSSLLHSAVFFGLNFLLHLAHRRNLFQRYKIQKHKYPSPELLRKALWNVVPKHVTAPVVLWLTWPVFQMCGVHTDSFPSMLEVVGHIFVYIIIQDTLFYWSHRLLHTSKWLYKNVHKQHHEFYTPVGISAEYAHGLEDFFNTTAMLAGPLLLGCHLFTLWVWVFLRIWETVDAHSGYSFPLWLSPWSLLEVADSHDFHHSHNQGSFGSFFGTWDWLMGTDVAFNEWKKKQTAAPTTSDRPKEKKIDADAKNK
ncbi:aldehyde oxygenase (deformylating) [Balamuthia mandrillaris]